jgi:hypothetical protein
MASERAIDKDFCNFMHSFELKLPFYAQLMKSRDMNRIECGNLIVIRPRNVHKIANDSVPNEGQSCNEGMGASLSFSLSCCRHFPHMTFFPARPHHFVSVCASSEIVLFPYMLYRPISFSNYSQLCYMSNYYHIPLTHSLCT